MPAVSILIKPASSGCNIACRYCFYHAISENREIPCTGVMDDDTLKLLISQALQYAEGFASFAWQGGEPCLAGLPFYEKAVTYQNAYNQKGLTIQNTIQTNGLLLDDTWAAFLHQNHFLVGLSLDGTQSVHDRNRVDRQGRGTFTRVMATVDLLRKYDVDFNICSVLTKQTANHIEEVYQFFKAQGCTYLQFIPCMDAPGQEKMSYSLTPALYGKALCKLFDLWYKDFMDGSPVEIRMFSNLAQIAAGFAPEECGMCGKCNTYFAVESDGSVYPCDFYTHDVDKLGTLADGFQVLYNSPKSTEFMESSVPKPQKCTACPYFYLCRGGCRNWRPVLPDGSLGVHKLCTGYQIFFAHCEKRIQILGDCIRKKYHLPPIYT